MPFFEKRNQQLKSQIFERYSTVFTSDFDHLKNKKKNFFAGGKSAEIDKFLLGEKKNVFFREKINSREALKNQKYEAGRRGVEC